MNETAKYYTSRKFILACVFTITGIVALFSEHLGGGEFIALTTSVLALYGTANVVERRGEDR